LTKSIDLEILGKKITKMTNNLNQVASNILDLSETMKKTSTVQSEMMLDLMKSLSLNSMRESEKRSLCLSSNNKDSSTLSHYDFYW
jgi:hypothetical protein